MLGGCATAGASDMSAPQVGPASETPSLTPHANLSTYRSTRTHSQTALPVRLRIPAIDVDTRLVKLGLERDKSIEVPDELGVAGWWKGGPRPGQTGPAVIMGHVAGKDPPFSPGSTRCSVATRFWSIGKTAPPHGSS